MKNSLTLIIVAIILVVAGIFLFSRQSNGPEASPSSTPTLSSSPTPITIQLLQNSIRQFTVIASDFKFDVKEIKVKKDDRVRIIFKNAGGVHDWVIDEFNVRTKQLQVGQQETIEFIVDKTGQFQYYCSMGAHRQMGMWGTLVVE